MEETKTVFRPPEIPSKHDIIPIHASDRGTFKKCRRRWDWSSPMRRNLVPEVSMTGVVLPLWFGSGIHWALRHYYDPTLQRDPVEVFKTWWQIQWHGGVIDEDWLETVYDRSPREIQIVPAAKDPEGLWDDAGEEVTAYKVRGLKDLLADPEIDAFEEHRELGVGMLNYYKGYAEEFDNFTVLMAEHTFSVPILNPHGDTMMRIDPRDGNFKEVHLRGTQDAVVQDDETEKYGVLEHKTAAKIDEEYFLKLDKDPQVTTYMYAAEREAKMHDLPYKKIDFTIYNAIRKAFPRPPTMVRGGVFSIDRSKESTTPELLQEFIDDNGIQVIVDADEKLQAYIEYVNTIGHSQFIIRNNPELGSKPVTRNRQELKAAGMHVFLEAHDMLDDPALYPNPSGERYCTRCPFRGPCIAADDGSDFEFMLDDMFDVNWTR